MTDYGLTVSPSSFIGSTPGRARSWGVFPAGRVKLWSMETNCSGVSKYFKYQRSWHIRDTVAELIDSQPVFLLKVKPSITLPIAEWRDFDDRELSKHSELQLSIRLYLQL